MDKSYEQAQETRRRNKEARQTQRVAREADEALVLEADEALVLEALRAVLKDPEATTAQHLYAVAVLDNMKYYHFAPYGVRYTGDVDIAPFHAALQEREETENK